MYRLIFIALFACAYTQLQLESPCDLTTIGSQSDFNISLFSGDWYQLARINNSVETGDCSRLSLSESQIYEEEVSGGKLIQINGTISASQNYNASNVLNVTLGGISSRDYLIIATDYKQYALLYTCADVSNGTKLVWAWQLVRNSTYSNETRQALENAIADTEISNVTWRETSYSAEACQVRNSGINLKISQIFIFFIGLFFIQDL